MTNITPTLRKKSKPTLTQLLSDHKADILKSLSCCQIGVIKEYDPGVGGQRAPNVDVLIAPIQVTSTAEDGTQTLAEYPILKGVPIYFADSGNYIVTMPIMVGQECLVIFSDREIDNWLIKGAGVPPTTGRLHDLSDAIAIAGVRSNPRAVANISTDAVQIRSVDYTGPDGTGECVEIGPGKITLAADDVVLHARNKLSWDAGGTGQVTQPGQIDTYTDGVPSNHHNPNPPQVP